MAHFTSYLAKHSMIMAASTLSIILIMLFASTAQAQSVYNNVQYNAGYAQQPYCREQVQSIRIGNRVQEGYGTACLQPDGSWKLVSDVRANSVNVTPQPVYYAPTYTTTNYPAPYYPPQYYNSSYSRPYYHARSPLVFASFSSGYHGGYDHGYRSRHGFNRGWNGYRGGRGGHHR